MSTDWRSKLRFAAGASVFLLLLVLGTARAFPPRPLGDSVVRAEIPEKPGFPEGIAGSGNKMYVSSPAQFGHAGDAKIFVFDTNKGTPLREYAIPAGNPLPTHGLVGLALDGSGHLYVADVQRGVVQLDLSSGKSTTYAVIPDLPPCVGELLDSCSPTITDRPPFPNDIVFDGAGNAYVSDSAQATIFKVPPPSPAEPEPQEAKVWFQDARLDREGFGPNGIRFTPDRSQLCIAVTGPPGAIYCVNSADPKELGEPQHDYDDDPRVGRNPPQGPDNMAFGKSGNLYVALAFSNKVDVLEPGQDKGGEPYSGPASGPRGDVPWDAPAGVAFDNASGSLLVVNHALNSGVLFPDLFVVFDVFLKEAGDPLEKPSLPTVG